MADNLSPEQRRKAMRAVKGSDTSLERACDAAFSARGWVYERNAPDLPGKPDFVFRELKLIVFADGDFWHGWRFPLWRDALAPFWQAKIERTRRRDQRNFRKLRRAGWKVLRVWGRQILRDLPGVVARVAQAIDELTPRPPAKRSQGKKRLPDDSRAAVNTKTMRKRKPR